ncbi:unnamed protein product [Closterium sp. Naga37s-1]|nr:unnamed protein product [Closterium sp. Naga37s-1]
MPAAATSRPGEAWRRAGRAEELVAGLAAGDAKVRLRAVRDVKNAAIGSRTRKLAFIRLRAMPRCTFLPRAPLFPARLYSPRASLLVRLPPSRATFLCASPSSARRAALFPAPPSRLPPFPKTTAARVPFSVPPPHPAPYCFRALLFPRPASSASPFPLHPILLVAMLEGTVGAEGEEGAWGAEEVQQAAAAVGSLACGLPEGVHAVLAAGAVLPLLRCLLHPHAKVTPCPRAATPCHGRIRRLMEAVARSLRVFDLRLDSEICAYLPRFAPLCTFCNTQVVEAAARSLRLIFQSTPALPRGSTAAGDWLSPALSLLPSLLASPNETVSEVAASVAAHCVHSPQQQAALAAADGLLSLTRLLASSPRCTDAALLALAAAVKGNRQQAAALVDMGGGAALAAVVSLTRHPSPATRLNACRCLLHVEAALWPHGGAITAVPRSFLQHPAPALAALPAPATTAVPPATTAVPPATTATAPVCAAGAPSPATAAAAAAARGRVERVARSSGSGSASIASDGNGRAGGRGGGVKRDAWGGLKAGGMTKGDRGTWLRQQGHEQAACGREGEEGRAQHVVCGALLSPRTGPHMPATALTPATAACGERPMRVGVGVGMGVGVGAAAAVDVNVAAVVLVALINLLPLPDQVGEQAPGLLQQLLGGREDVQWAAFNAHAASELPIRRQALDLKVLQPLLRCLDASQPMPLRAAACSCLHSLSRSIKNLRTGLSTAPIILAVLNLAASPDASAQVRPLLMPLPRCALPRCLCPGAPSPDASAQVRPPPMPLPRCALPRCLCPGAPSPDASAQLPAALPFATTNFPSSLLSHDLTLPQLPAVSALANLLLDFRGDTGALVHAGLLSRMAHLAAGGAGGQEGCMREEGVEGGVERSAKGRMEGSVEGCGVGSVGGEEWGRGRVAVQVVERSVMVLRNVAHSATTAVKQQLLALMLPATLPALLLGACLPRASPSISSSPPSAHLSASVLLSPAATSNLSATHCLTIVALPQPLCTPPGLLPPAPWASVQVQAAALLRNVAHGAEDDAHLLLAPAALHGTLLRLLAAKLLPARPVLLRPAVGGDAGRGGVRGGAEEGGGDAEADLAAVRRAQYAVRVEAMLALSNVAAGGAQAKDCVLALLLLPAAKVWQFEACWPAGAGRGAGSEAAACDTPGNVEAGGAKAVACSAAGSSASASAAGGASAAGSIKGREGKGKALAATLAPHPFHHRPPSSPPHPNTTPSLPSARLSSAPPPLILHLLRLQGCTSLRLASLWCLTNLCRPACPGADRRAAAVRAAEGVVAQLERLAAQGGFDIACRAKLALDYVTRES